MKRRTIATVFAVALQFLVLQGAVHAQSTSTYHSTGAYAETMFTSNQSFIDLFVARGCPSSPCTATNLGTYIVWHSINTNPDGSTSFTEGDGIIPDSAFD